MILQSFRNNKCGIFGLGRTGIASYNAFNNGTNQIICYDDSTVNRENFATLYPQVALVGIDNATWADLDYIVISPGVPCTHDIFHLARRYNISIISDIDVLFQECLDAKFIGITGTNGKSTTTALIEHILLAYKKNYKACGNIGEAVLGLPNDLEGYVLELSSFQLDLITKLRVDISILLNITPDHLDRHLTFENYINAKKKLLTSPFTKSYRIIGIDNAVTHRIYEAIKNENSPEVLTVPIATDSLCRGGVSIINHKLYDQLFSNHFVYEIPVVRSLLGKHNEQNMAAAYTTCRLLGVPPLSIIEAISNFIGLPYRNEYIGAIKNVNIYNDSKATNADSSEKSILLLNNIYWIAGGIAKDGGIDSLKPLLGKIKKAYLFGKDSNLFATTLANNNVEYYLFDNIKQAYDQAFDDALTSAEECNILFSPSASSLDQFKNFEHRGQVFTKLVQLKLKEYESA